MYVLVSRRGYNDGNYLRTFIIEFLNPFLQLKALVDIHGEDKGMGGKLTKDEIKIITGLCIHMSH